MGERKDHMLFELRQLLLPTITTAKTTTKNINSAGKTRGRETIGTTEAKIVTETTTTRFKTTPTIAITVKHIQPIHTLICNGNKYSTMA